MILPPVPFQSDLIDRVNLRSLLQQGMEWIPRMSKEWLIFMRALVLAVQATASALGSASLTGQGAAIATTALSLPTLTTGLYRVTWYLRITRAATTSSSATLTLSWVDGGIACSLVGAAVTGNTTATVQTGTTLVHLDQNTTLDYAVAYASVGGTSMQYALSVIVEQIP